MPKYEAPGAIRREPGETFASFSGRQRASQLAAQSNKPKKQKPRPSARKVAEQRAADRVDGFDRDDIGESTDR